jgi:hypothetical protein
MGVARLGGEKSRMQTHSRSAPAGRAPARVDRRWNLLETNAGAVRLVEFLIGPLPPGTAVNLADALVGPAVLRPFLDNWEDVVRYFIRSVQADGTAETAALLDRLLAYPDVDAVVTRTVEAPPGGPVLPLRFRKAKPRWICSRRSRRSARPRTSRCRSSGSSASSGSTSRPPTCPAAWPPLPSMGLDEFRIAQVRPINDPIKLGGTVHDRTNAKSKSFDPA